MAVRKFFRSKVNQLLTMAFVLLAIPLLVIVFIISSRSIQVTRNEVSHTYKSTLSLTVGQFSDRLRDLEMLASSLSIDDRLNAMYIAQRGSEDLFEYVLFLDLLRGYVNQRLMHSNISVILPRQGWIISTRDRIRRIETYAGFDAYWKMIPDVGGWAVRRTLRDADATCLSIVRGYVNDGQSNGIFVIEIARQDVLGALAGLDEAGEVSNVFLIDDTGNLYAQSPDIFADAALMRGIRNAQADGSLQTNYVIQGKSHLILQERLPSSQCHIGVVIDEAAILQPILTTRRWSYMAVAFFMIAIVLYMTISYRRVSEPIDDIKNMMKAVEAGDFSARVYTGHHNEISEVAVALNHMAGRLDALIKERYIGSIQLTQAQLKLLRTQIQPHFLYNCLFTLYTLIKNEDNDAAADMALYLGKYYQINTRPEGGELSLRQELEHVRILINIQRIRFGDSLRYEEAIDPQLEALPIPSLSLLTVVENFLTHGWKEQQGDAILRITAHVEEGDAVLRVSDTGIGVGEGQLHEIQQSIDQAVIDQADAHGLQNVMIRFSLLYGGETRMRVEANSPHGLIVHVQFPIRRIPDV